MIRRKHIATGLKILVGLTLLYVLLRQANGDDVRNLLLHVRPLELVAGVCALAVAAAFNAVRWHAVLSQLGSRPALSTAFVGTFEGVFFNLFLPTSVGGDAMRAYRAFDRGATGGAAIESALIDRAVGLWGVGLSLVLASPFAVAMPKVASYGTLFAISLVIVAGGAVAAVVGRVTNPQRFKSWMRAIADLVHNYGLVVTSWRFLTVMLPALLMSTVLTCGAMWLIARSLDLDLSFLDATIVLQASTLAALLPVSFGGWGVREGVTVFLLTATGIAMSGAVAASLLFGLGLAVLGAIGAIVWLCSPYRGLVRFSEMRPRRNTPAAPELRDPEGTTE